jgi:hypothetical protein
MAINIYCTHLSTRKLNRFLDFYKQRFRAGVPSKEIIDTWNRFAKYPEDTM